ncbi:MAG: hypothetical protein ACLFVD_04885 [Dehalococcoidia bacterium]
MNSKGTSDMAIREKLIDKIQSLPEDKLEEIADFLQLLETGGTGQTELAEHGMAQYLEQLLTYEEMLAAGKIRWR